MNIKRRAVIAGLLGTPALIGAANAGQTLFMPASAEPAPAFVPSFSPPLVPAAPARVLPRWQRFAVQAPRTEGRPAISIIIDDLGVMHPGTPRAVALPGPLTLAWFPFARELPQQVAAGAAHGHEALLHMPMQAFGNSIAWTGPDPLRVDLSPEENLRRLTAAMDAVPDTVGLNNHMGSVATRDVALMEMVARETKRRDMLFLDSLTITHSVAFHEAAAAGVPAASRDVFLDDAYNRPAIDRQLELTEHIARKEGHVIAIGHPRALTLDALEAWLPGLAARGFVLWPLSATVAWQNEIAMPVV